MTEPKTEFCKMNANNQITVPKPIREHFDIDNIEGEQTVLLEVKFMRVVRPTNDTGGN